MYFRTTGMCCKYPGSCEKLCSSLCKFWAAIHFFVCTFRCWSCTGTGNLSSVNFVQSPGFCFTFLFRPLWRYLLLFCVTNWVFCFWQLAALEKMVWLYSKLSEASQKRAICGQLKLLKCSYASGEIKSSVLKNGTFWIWQNDFMWELDMKQDNGMRWSNLTALE